MDPDMVMEVPDTPDRAAFRRQMKNSSLLDCNGKGTTSVDGNFLFSQAKLARISESSNNLTSNSKMIDLSQESPSPIQFHVKYRGTRHKEEDHSSKQIENNQKSGYGKLGVRSLEFTDGLTKGMKNGNSMKEFSSCNGRNETDNLKCHGRLVPSGKDNVSAHPLNSQSRNDQLKSKPYYQELRNSSNQGLSSSSFVKKHYNEVEKGSCGVSQYVNKQSNHRHEDLALLPKNMGHRKLVRNGCISPSNIAINKNGVKAKGNEEGTSISIHSSNSVGKIADKGKGKEVINNGFLATSQHFEPDSQFKRSSMHQKQEPLISDNDYESRRIQNTENGSTHNRVGSSSLPFFHAACTSESDKAPYHLSTSRGDSANGGAKLALSIPEKHKNTTFQSIQDGTRAQECFRSDSDAPYHTTFQSIQDSSGTHDFFQLDLDAPYHTGKRKDRFAHSNAGECSSSTFDRTRLRNDRIPVKPSYTRSTRSRKLGRADTSITPVVDIDELDSNTQEENNELCDESVARSIQLESDEVLARQLQEQFYLESPPVGASEVDSALEFPWLLEEDDLYANRRSQLLQGENLLPALLGRSRFRHSSARMPYRGRAVNRLGRTWRNISRRAMSLEERLDLLEALETAFENGNMEAPDTFLGIHRDFNENDYEMLLTLDENNHHVGATERQINSLPQSLIQNTGSEEACTICLEAPSVGDTIRHLPCLHKFHKACIDTWLRRKRSCPICKSGIN